MINTSNLQSDWLFLKELQKQRAAHVEGLQETHLKQMVKAEQTVALCGLKSDLSDPTSPSDRSERSTQTL